MRDLTVYPITAAEVMMALHTTATAIADDPELPGSIDGLAVMFVKDFLEQPGMKTQLAYFLDRVQPKPKPPILENMTVADLAALLHTAIWDPNQRKPSEIGLYNTRYKGMSIRGSAVYDSSPGYGATSVRLYVRMMPDGLRVELNEDNFELVRSTQQDPQPSSFSSNEPVSATMQWWQGVVERWKTRNGQSNLPKSTES